MDPTQSGSFGAATGGTDALKAAMARRGMDASMLDQTSAGSAQGMSEVAPPLPEDPANLAPSMDQTLQAPQPTSQTADQMSRSAEMDIALKALAGVVKTESKIAETVLGLK